MPLFTKKTLDIDNVTYVFAEKGEPTPEKPSLLLLHGFANDKYSWGVFAVNLPEDIHAVALDLPGHGSSTKPDLDSFTFMSFVHAINQFVEGYLQAGQSIHVIGLSFGGTLAGLYAAYYPGRVTHVTIICPSMKTPKPSEFRQIYESTGHVMWFPETVSELKTMQTFCFHEQDQDISEGILVEVLDIMKERYPYMKQMYEKLILVDENRTLLEENLCKIIMPVQVVWGENDRVVDVSGADVIRDKLRKCRVDIFPECGHSVNKEKPQELVHVVLDFQKEISVKNTIAEVV